MTESLIRYERDDHGVVTLTLDDHARSTNTLTVAFREALAATVARLEEESSTIAGVVLTSAKKTFVAGADLSVLVKATRADAEQITARATRTKSTMRRLERLGVPVVAVIAGSALGGGAELALCAHRRIVVDDNRIALGFPEVTLGLLPGGGGIVRSTRLMGVRAALDELLLTGATVTPSRALDLGLIDELAPDAASAVAAARAWIAANPQARQPWDDRTFAFPGGDGRSTELTEVIGEMSAGLRARLKGAPNIAPHHILCAAIEGAIVDVDTALAIETRYYVDLVTGPVSTNMIQGSFLDRQAIKAGESRPAGVAPRTFSSVGVVGAGMMGAGIAYCCARARVDVTLHDVNIDAAEKGKAYAVKVLERAMAHGQITAPARDEVLARITTSAKISDLAGCDAIIEAVFEDAGLKAKVFAELESIVKPDALLASNTSTLPITGLAMALKEPRRLVGMHFFSPVDRMELVEVIRGSATDDGTLAWALDLAAQIRKTPIVVKDSRGFFTSRVFGKFTREGVAMLAERVPPATINQASSQAGYPVPVLQLCDDLSLTLPKKIRAEAMAAAEAAGEEWIPHPSEPIYDRMVDELQRPGRTGGAGFYEYEDGARAGLWSGLSEAFGPFDAEAVPFDDLVDRLLFSEAIEALRCMDEGIIESAAEANVGSLLGISYPTWTGGVIQFVNGYPGGPAGFLARARELTDRYGARFAPPQLLVDKVHAGERIE